MTSIADMNAQAQPPAGPDDQSAAAPAPAPDAPPRTIFHVEREQLGPDMGEMFKPYRRFFGKPPKGMDLEKVEVEWDSQDDGLPSELWLVPRGDECPGGEGASDRLKDGRILTFKPDKYGTEAERQAAGKKPLLPLKWEEHNYVVPDFDAIPPEPPQGASQDDAPAAPPEAT